MVMVWDELLTFKNNYMSKPKTIGEQRIRAEFNPGNDDTVQNLKEYFAEGINRLEKLKSFRVPGEGSTTNPEILRCIASAQTKLEEAAMWAVKAATFEPEDYA